ncbi:hypothetical protein PZ897_03785 [Hoeflea sp. YIM 152468]|uniref:hypothetical protein n=1 Tax=Hoeflea sp. YIM 152468 TaxID=3031759 RepID=UPI0023DB6AEF|nr:hypothetical protein [Hoeflea sp. YIM 152468]MDF1607292.1 hypothetical protein [Hoeflea sp. YIM 152468]
MTTILFFDTDRCRPSRCQAPPGYPADYTAKVLIFTGVRHERLDANSTSYASRPHEPMFDDPVPAKPVRKKRQPRKNG